MTRKPTVENLLDQILNLPDEAQSEIVQMLIEGRGEATDLYRAEDDHERALDGVRA